MTPATGRMPIPPLYAMLDPEQIRGKTPENALLELMEGGAKIVQLRAKIMAPREFLELARKSREITRRYDCRLIVNDRVDIALACDADGVHLGQEDLPLRAARKIMADSIIGISTHDLAQARIAESEGADYIGFGPMFGTNTKETGYSARGVDRLREIHAAVKVPIVAIGGINASNAAQVWQAGADSAAIISDILHAENIAAKVRKILSAVDSMPHWK